MRRREFIAGLGSAAASQSLWPLAARAQQAERVRRVGVLMNASEGVADAQANVSALREALQALGWVAGGNLALDVRWGGGDAALTARHAAELIQKQADVVVAAGAPVVAAIQRAGGTVPIVFAQAIDPVGAGTVESLARPGGRATGFTQFEYSLSGKWPELVKEVAPRVKRVAVVRDSTNPAGIGQWAIIQAAAASLGMEVSPVSVREQAEIEHGIAAFARGPDLAMIVPVSARAVIHQQAIIEQATHYRLPAVYPYRSFVEAGGLISYGADLQDQYRRAAGYVDRILKGEKPGDLPVQAPTKYELAVNLKTAKALGLAIPPTVLTRADKVIE
jgi:putative tryptophan/tyrosine transport system substrate-binding protein